MSLESDDYMCPNCVTPWKCNGPHIEKAAGPTPQAGDQEPAREAGVKPATDEDIADDEAMCLCDEPLDWDEECTREAVLALIARVRQEQARAELAETERDEAVARAEKAEREIADALARRPKTSPSLSLRDALEAYRREQRRQNAIRALDRLAGRRR